MNHPSSGPSRFFPPTNLATADGLLAVGGKLTPEWLLDAYSHGIFPWPIFDDEAHLAWWTPDPRAVLELDDLRLSRRLRRTCRSARFQVTCNQDFSAVLHGCATAQERAGETWLLPPMIAAYEKLHALGYAHSVEVWHEGKLAGGIYGVSVGAAFSAESKFYYERDASKVALVSLVSHLRARGYHLLDIQQLTEHTERLGATEIPRNEFMNRLRSARSAPVTFGQTLLVDATK